MKTTRLRSTRRVGCLEALSYSERLFRKHFFVVSAAMVITLTVNFLFVITIVEVFLSKTLMLRYNHHYLNNFDHRFVDETDSTALWLGTISNSGKRRTGLQQYNITMVISHCDKDINWIWRDFIPQQLTIKNVIVYSKCGNAVQGAPPNATIINLPNIGRCDHTYAYHMANMNSSSYSMDEDETIIFIKDNPRRMNKTRSLETLLHIASVNGFGCVEQNTEFGDFRPSYYHNYKMLSEFSIKDGWVRELDRDSNEVFVSEYVDLGEWVGALNLSVPAPLTPVCYGGTFAATVSQIQAKKPLWSSIEKSLSRGDNIEEGHFCERVWAGLLSKPISKHCETSLLEKSTTMLWDRGVFCGALAYQYTVSNDTSS